MSPPPTTRRSPYQGLIHGADQLDELGYDLTQKIMDDLSQVPGLKIAPFTMEYDRDHVDPQAVGRDLNVRAILLGRIGKRDNTLIISTELIDTLDSRVVWAMSTATKYSDSLLVPDEIVAGISEKIGVKLGPDDKKKREAEMLYIKGRNSWNKRTADGINKALSNFNQTLKVYPNYPKAYAGLADCHSALATYGVNSPKEAFPKAHDEALRALDSDLDPSPTFQFRWKRLRPFPCACGKDLTIT